MERNILARAAEFLKKSTRHKRWRRALTGMAAVVVFITSYMMILPAITMSVNQGALPPGVDLNADPDYTAELTLADGSVVTIGVYDPDENVPEGAVLVAELFEEGGEDYLKAEETLLNSEDVEPYDGMLAMDLHFEDAEGNEVEPTGSVYVDMEADALLPVDVDPDSVAVQHHVELDADRFFGLVDGSETTVEVVADGSENTGDVVVDPTESPAPSETPAVTETPDVTETPETTEIPETTESPEVTKPVPTETPAEGGEVDLPEETIPTTDAPVTDSPEASTLPELPESPEPPVATEEPVVSTLPELPSEPVAPVEPETPVEPEPPAEPETPAESTTEPAESAGDGTAVEATFAVDSFSTFTITWNVLEEVPEEPELVCGLEEHSHFEDCCDADGNLICTLEEHTHSEDCYAVELPEEEIPMGAFPEELPEGYMEYRFENEDGLSVLAYAPENAFDGQEVTLFAEVLTEESDAYAQAAENLANAGTEYTGMMAMDIRFQDADGSEVEPNAEAGPVYVDIQAEALLPEDVDTSTLAVQHHAEIPDGGFLGTGLFAGTEVTVETVADASTETGTITAVPVEAAIPETLPALADEPMTEEIATLEEPAEEETEESAAVPMNVEASFGVESFSYFTITWTSSYSSLTVYMVDTNGSPIPGNYYKRYEGGDKWIQSTTAVSQLAPQVEGYSFDHAQINNNEIKRLSYINYKWQYSDSDTGNRWVNIYSTVYFVYTATENWNIVETVDDDNIKINLFDIQKSYNGSLLFVSKDEDGTSGYNKYQDNNVYQGIVSSILNNNHIPTKKDQPRMSLADIFTEGGDGVVKAYTGLTGLFQQDQKGYYYFDSSKNFATIAAKDENGTWKIPQSVTSFTVYDRASEFYDNFYKDKNVYFLPFNGYEGVMANDKSSMLPTASTGMETNYHFGMTVEFSFAMPEGGMMNGEPMIFNFTGDDDVWVFIDDVLVLDMGGMHDAVSGSINFADGTVKVDRVANSAGNIGASSNLKTIFQNAGRTWNNANYKEHTLKFFYLERGAGASNCKITFNMPPVPSNALWVGKELKIPEGTGDNLQDYMNNLEFSYKVYKDDNSLLVTEGTSYDIYNARMQKIGTDTVGEDGIFTVKPGQYAVFPELCPVNAEYTYYVEELITDIFNDQYLGVEYTISGEGGKTSEIQDDNITDRGEFTGYKTDELSPEKDQNRVVFQNKVNVDQLSTLDITKTLHGGDALNDVFTFEVKTGGELLPVGTSYQVLKSGGNWDKTGDVITKSISEQDGPGHIKLKAGETARLLVLSGTTYSVEEIELGQGWDPPMYSQTLKPKDGVISEVPDADDNVDGIQGTVSALDCEIVVTVHNELPIIYGSLSLQKLVDYIGNDTYTTEDTFTFHLTYDGLTANTQFPVTYTLADESSGTMLTAENVTGEDGTQEVVLEVTLKQNQTATIGNLPVGKLVTITEPDHDGYSVKWTVNSEEKTTPYASAIITGDEPVAVTCTNTTGAVLPSTGGMGVAPYLTFGSLLTLGAGLLLLQRRRKEGSDAV